MIKKLYNRRIYPWFVGCFPGREYTFVRGQDAKWNSICVYASYIPPGKMSALDGNLKRQLKTYKGLGFTNVLVFTYDGRLTDLEMSGIVTEVDGDAALIVFRRNRGHDFYSWKRGMEHARAFIKCQLTEVLFTNDSVIGPLTDLTEDMKWFRSDSGKCTLKSLTSSEEIAFHLQSYFLYFNSAMCRSMWLDWWLKRIKAYREKSEIIGFFEVGASVEMRAQGVQLEARYEVDEKRNPTLYSWEDLLLKRGFPFIKKSLFTFHRELLRAGELTSTLGMLSKKPGYAIEAIEQIADLQKASGKV